MQSSAMSIVGDRFIQKVFVIPNHFNLGYFDFFFFQLTVNYWFMVSMCRGSFGCVWEAAKHESSIRVVQADSQVPL